MSIDLIIFSNEDILKDKWCQARYLVHSHDDVLWTNNIEDALGFLRQNLIEISKTEDYHQ